MRVSGSQAMIPKARGMYAKRLTISEYEELMRRRTVQEVAAVLKKHPYFQQSLATLSTGDLHRAQLEELLNMDILNKYDSLIHYDFTADSFTSYFLAECEVGEILKALHFMSIGAGGRYINLMPPFLNEKINADLFAMSKAKTFGEVVEALRHSPYYKVLQARHEQDPNLLDYPLTEAALLSTMYQNTFALAERAFSGRELEAVKSLFLQEIEIYNLSLIRRVKAYFPNSYTANEICALLIPYNYKVSRKKIEQLCQTKDLSDFTSVSRQIGTEKFIGTAGEDLPDVTGARILYRHAQHLLHLTTSPSTALAAFLTLAKLERENVVNVIEGVRYGLPPEKIRALRY